MRLHGVAPSSEFEAQASLYLPTGASITSPDQRSPTGIHPHRGVFEVEGGVVEAQFHEGGMVVVAIHIPALALARFEITHFLMVTAHPPVGGPAHPQRWQEQGTFAITDGYGELHGELTSHLVDFHLMEAESITLVGAVFAELVEAGVGVTEQCRGFDDPVTALQWSPDVEHARPGIAAAVS